MASGFRYQNVDLDSILAPQHAGWPVASTTEFQSVSVDLKSRYAALSTGNAPAATEFRAPGVLDLSTIFAAFGSTNVQVLTQPGNISGSSNAGVSGTVTSGTTTCAGEKGGGTYTYTWHIANGSGFSFTAPNSATTAVAGSVSANSTLTGGIYCTISDGVSSVNTNTVSISLHNTYVLVSVASQPGNVSGSSAAGYPSGTVTSGSTSCAGANGNGSYSYTWHTSGCTAASPNSASTDFYATVNAASVDNASAYCTISDGVSSINTNTIAVTLTNTTPAYIYNGTVTAGEIILGSGSSEIRQFGWALAALTGGTVMGSITPASDTNGKAIGAVYGSLSGYPTVTSRGTVLAIYGSLPQNYFTTLTVDGVAYASSSASLTTSGSYTLWNWSGSAAIDTSGGNHSVTIAP